MQKLLREQVVIGGHHCTSPICIFHKGNMIEAVNLQVTWANMGEATSF